jgi:MoaA/NifB/PqqE/SkfB family radical SAM enzyme
VDAVEHAEMVEKQLDAMIQRRARKGGVDPDEREEIWKESVRRYNARRREENRREWCGYFERLAACLRARAEEYDHRAQMLMDVRPKGA